MHLKFMAVPGTYVLSMLLLIWILLWGTPVFAQKTHTVFYEGSENELHVYRVYGHHPGKTLLLIGGIQGDEPGGFLAADLYADMVLEKGNLIVVPRANFPSILQRRRKINEDMNRKFADDSEINYEAKVVKVLKQLIRESDFLLNLHEGSGFYSPDYKSKMRNPKRFGQSIIADTQVFENARAGIRIDLKAMGEKVVEKINSHIPNPKFKFHFNNHRTRMADSIHKEQRKSATYYALYTCMVPAFGIESAKSLPLEQKVRQHIYAVNGFMDLLGIVPETPGVDLKKPRLQYMVISVNGSIPVVVEDLRHLAVERGDTVEVKDIKVNYTRGLSVDVLGSGSRFNDLGKKIVVTGSTRIVAKKDFYPCGSVFLDINGGSQTLSGASFSGKASCTGKASAGLSYRLKINGRRVAAENNAHVKLVRGDLLEIVDIVAPGRDPSLFTVNFKGFVGNKDCNTGEDRGYVIDTGGNALMPRYSTDKKGNSYYVVTTVKDREVGRLYIDINPDTAQER